MLIRTARRSLGGYFLPGQEPSTSTIITIILCQPVLCPAKKLFFQELVCPFLDISVLAPRQAEDLES
jgi:hypothetical protein